MTFLCLFINFVANFTNNLVKFLSFKPSGPEHEDEDANVTFR